MIETAALRVALSVLHMPSALRRIKSEPLPPGVELLLQILAGDATLQQDAADRTERPTEMVGAAAAFFVEQILLSPGNGSYRALGCSPDAPGSELRRNMALLLRWLHPDKTQTDDRRVLAERVTLAWENLKTPERRSAYDEEQLRILPKSKQKKRRRVGSANQLHAGLRIRRSGTEGARTSYLRRALNLLFGR